MNPNREALLYALMEGLKVIRNAADQMANLIWDATNRGKSNPYYQDKTGIIRHGREKK